MVRRISGDANGPRLIQPLHMNRRQGGSLPKPSRAANCLGAQVRSMKSDGSEMKSSYSSAFMYSASTYWYIASSGRPWPGLEGAVAEGVHHRGRVGQDRAEVQVRLEVILEGVASGAGGGMVVHGRAHVDAGERERVLLVRPEDGHPVGHPQGDNVLHPLYPRRVLLGRALLAHRCCLPHPPGQAVQAVASRTAAWASGP